MGFLCTCVCMYLNLFTLIHCMLEAPQIRSTLPIHLERKAGQALAATSVCARTREREFFCVCVLEQACPCVSAVLLFHQQVPVWSFACRTVTGCKCDQYEWEKDREGVIERAQQNQPQIKPWLNPSPPISHVLALLCPCIIDKMYGERWAQLQSVILLAFCAVEARK